MSARTRYATWLVLRALCAATGHRREATTVCALTRCTICRTVWIETR